MADPDSELLARHYRQLRTTFGTVLLGPARYGEDVEIAPSWFVDACPLEPAAAVEVIAKRHGLGDASAALARLQDLRRRLEDERHPDAGALADLPES